MDLFCSQGGGQTVEAWNSSVVMVVDRLQNFGTLLLSWWWTDCRTVELFCSYGGGQTVELWTCSVVMVVDGLELWTSSVVMVDRL